MKAEEKIEYLYSSTGIKCADTWFKQSSKNTQFLFPGVKHNETVKSIESDPVKYLLHHINKTRTGTL